MKRGWLLAVCALATALEVIPALGQQDTGKRSESELNVSIALEDAPQSRAGVANLALPIEQGSRSSSAPPEQQRRFEPADFARPNRLESIQIAADDLPRRTTAVAVRCQAFIAADGNRGEYHCVSDDNRAFEDVIQAVIDAVPTQRFVAARVDGENVRVLMSFAVYVDCSSGSCLAIAARNHGYHIERLGLDYVDPQPIVEDDSWYEGFDDKLRWLRTWMPRIRNVDRRDQQDDRMPYLIAAEIDASGIAAPACLYWVGRSLSGPVGILAPTRSRSAPVLPWRTVEHIEHAIASFGRVRYVPAMIDGAPATLRLYERSVTSFQLEPGGHYYGIGGIAC
jgi:hypothetical protein